MDTLPPEVVIHIIKQLPGADARQLRAVSGRFDALALPFAFRAVKVVNTLPSIRSLRALLHHPRIRESIKTIAFIERAQIEDDRRLFYDIAEALSHTCSHIYLASKIRQLFLYFDTKYIGEWQHPQLKLQRAVMAGLAKAIAFSTTPSPLRQLGISGLLPYDNPSWLHLCPLFEPLNILSIQLVCSHDDSEDVINESMRHFFSAVLSHQILYPCTSLRKLTLGSKRVMPGVVPTLDFNGVTCPRLTSLSLKNVIFHWHGTMITGAEDFIVKHGKTLTTLRLQQCGLFIEEMAAAPERHWSEVWSRFATTLTALTYLEVDFKTGWLSTTQRRYYRGDPEIGAYEERDAVPNEDLDIPALEALRAKVSARATKPAGGAQ